MKEKDAMELERDDEQMDTLFEQAMDKLFVDAPEACTLVECLKTLTKDALLQHAKLLNIKGVSTLKKSDLAECVAREATERTEWIGRLAEEPREALRSILAASPCDCEVYLLTYMMYLSGRCTVFPLKIAGEPKWVVPHDLKHVLIEALDAVPPRQNAKNDRTVLLAEGLVEAYGWMPFFDFLDFMRVYHEDEEDMFAVVRVLKENDLCGAIYTMDPEFGVYNGLIEDIESLAEAISERSDLPYRKFSEVELRALLDLPSRFEGPEMNAAVRKLSEIGNMDRDDALDIAEDFISAMQQRAPIGVAMAPITERIVFQSSDQLNQLVGPLMAAYNAARQWQLKGHSPKELSGGDRLREPQSFGFGMAEGGFTAETVRREAPKVGRNDPCPCGSGKKYKKCCGVN